MIPLAENQVRPIVSIACAETENGDGLRTIRLLPPGEVKTPKGTFLMDAVAAELVVSAFREHGVDIPVDFEHESLRDDRIPNAVGWISKLWFDARTGLMALVKWNNEARLAIRQDRVRYLSPVLEIRNADMRVVRIHSVALTNFPAVPAQERVAASTQTQDSGEPMNTEIMQQMRVALTDRGVKLADDAKPDDVLTAALSFVQDKSKQPQPTTGTSDDATIAKVVRERFHMPAGASADAVILSVTLAADQLDVVRQIASGKEVEKERIAMDRVRKRIAEFRLNPNNPDAMRAALSLAKTAPDTFERTMDGVTPPFDPKPTVAPPYETFQRHTEIELALHNFEQNKWNKKLTSQLAFVNTALRDKGMDPLSETEKKSFQIVA